MLVDFFTVLIFPQMMKNNGIENYLYFSMNESSGTKLNQQSGILPDHTLAVKTASFTYKFLDESVKIINCNY